MATVPTDEEFLAYNQGVIDEFRAGDKSFPARAVVTAGEDRDRLYRLVSDGAGQYEKNTDRVFPVIVLEGVPAPV